MPSISELPEHTLVDIFSRLPAKTIIHCKCVCNTWRNLLSDPYFVKQRLSKSPTSIILHNFSSEGPSKPATLKLVEIEEKPHNHHLRHDPPMTFDLGFEPNPEIWLVGSVNGLVCLWQFNDKDRNFICNPITREYIVLPKQKNSRKSYAIVIYGFGVCPVTNHYKVVRIFQGRNQYDPSSMSDRFDPEVEVYTLGTDAWRNVGVFPYEIDARQTGQSVNGRLHWLVYVPNSPEMICCFDIEKEVFEPVCSPPQSSEGTRYKSLGVLGACLCLCDNSSESELVIWAMKDYGIKESWTKEIVIDKTKSTVPDWLNYEMVHLLKILEDGSVLMLFWEDCLFTYHPGSKTCEQLDDICKRYFEAMTYVPSFIRLTNFMPSENVVRF